MSDIINVSCSSEVKRRYLTLYCSEDLLTRLDAVHEEYQSYVLAKQMSRNSFLQELLTFAIDSASEVVSSVKAKGIQELDES